MARVVLALLGLVVLLALGAGGVLRVGAYLSLDRDFAYTRTVQELPRFSLQIGRATTAQLVLIDVGELTFRARVAGFGGGRGNVLLLHGFPESSIMYEPMLSALAEAGFQVVAFDQRGYSPGARPAAVEAYGLPSLTADVYAVADAVGFERFHLFGHDWGAVVGWRMVFEQSSRIQSWSALSIPHIGAYASAVATDPDQQDRSAYLDFFRMPWLPEAVFSFNDFSFMRSAVYGDHGVATREEYLQLFAEPGALTAALNWYRASAFDADVSDPEVAVPTLFVWGTEDPVVGDRALDAQRQYFDGNLEELELATGHWLLETQSSVVSRAVLAHLARID
ncbi:MAG: alpha/beta hydrolase [Pseudomonadota bacterium]